MIERKETTGEPEETTSSTTEKAVDETTSTSTVSKAEDTTSTDPENVEKAGLEQTPSESAAAGSQAGNTLTPGKQTGQAQDVFVPSSNVPGERMGHGKSPSEVSYSGKSVNPDLLKSPLFVELSKNIDSFGKALSKKVEAMEKSTQARLDNIETAMKKIEKFYSAPFYKSVQDTPENATNGKTATEKVQSGAARFSA